MLKIVIQSEMFSCNMIKSALIPENASIFPKT